MGNLLKFRGASEKDRESIVLLTGVCSSVDKHNFEFLRGSFDFSGRSGLLA